MTTVTVETRVNKSIEKVWECWTEPAHITGWNFATDEWTCPSAINDLTEGGKFSWRMEAKDGSFGFDYAGTYVRILKNDKIDFQLEDGRQASVQFENSEGGIVVTEKFEVEDANSVEMQRQGWQSILENFRKYTEGRN